MLNPVREIEFLGLIVNSQTMALSLRKEKVVKIKDQCLSFYKASEISLLHLTNIIGTLSSTIQAVLPTRLQFRISKINTALPHFGKADSHGKKGVLMMGQ